LASLDRLLTRIPGLRWLSWNVVMWGEKPLANDRQKEAPRA
jgi:hypothetical protein